MCCKLTLLRTCRQQPRAFPLKQRVVQCDTPGSIRRFSQCSFTGGPETTTEDPTLPRLQSEKLISDPLTLCRPVSTANADLEERLARDEALQRATAVSQRVGRLLLKAESGELALVDQLAQELLESEYRRALSCSGSASMHLCCGLLLKAEAGELALVDQLAG